METQNPYQPGWIERQNEFINICTLTEGLGMMFIAQGAVIGMYYTVQVYPAQIAKCSPRKVGQ